MSAHFLARIAHRALAGSDVRPRVASRFENVAAPEPVAERVSEVSSASAEVTRRSNLEAAPPLDTVRPAAVSQAESLTSSHTVTRTELIERVSIREVPVRTDPAAITNVTPAVKASVSKPSEPPTHRPTLAPTLTEKPAPSRLAREESAPEAKTARAPILEASRSPAVAATQPAPTAIPASVITRLIPPAGVATVTAPSPRVVDTAPPPIEIVIGRIEIRSDAPAPVPRAVAAPRRTAPSLDEYLRKRERGAS